MHVTPDRRNRVHVELKTPEFFGTPSLEVLPVVLCVHWETQTQKRPGRNCPPWIHSASFDSGPQPFWRQGLVSWEIMILPWTVEGWFGEDSGIYRALDFCYCCSSSTADRQELDPGGGWGPRFTSLFFFKKEKTIHVFILLVASSRFFVFRVQLMSELGSYSPHEESQVPAGLGSGDQSSHELCDLRTRVLTGIHTCVH